MAALYADTNVLYPYNVMDLFFKLSEFRVHTLLWSEYGLKEWERVVTPPRGLWDPTAARRYAQVIRDFFPDDEVRAEEYEHLVSGLTGPDPDDLPHMAAAIAGGAGVLVTKDVAGFPVSTLEPHGVRVSHPDAYLCELLDDAVRRDRLVEAVDVLLGERRRPPKTRETFLEKLSTQVPNFAERLRIVFKV